MLLGALLVLFLGMLTCRFTVSQILARRPSAALAPTRTPRPTWTPAAGAITLATATVDTTRFPYLPEPTETVPP